MSDSLSWIDDADTTRIRGILARSVDVIAAMRQDLDEHRCCVDNRLSTELLKRELSCQPATQRRVASAQRRARLRQLLRNPNPDNLATPSHEAVRNLRVDPTSAEQIEERVGAKSSFEIPKRQRGRHGRQPFDAHFPREDNEELSRRHEPINRHRKCRDKETATPRRLLNNFLSMLISWARRLDYLTNVVIGVLATALAILLFIRAGPADSHPDALRLVANAKMSTGQQAIPLEPRASLYPAQGFNILLRAFPEPLPKFAEDISGLLFLAAPLPASAPGITVLPYTGLPQALPAFPEDIAQLIMIASSPGPDGRDYLIRTLAFEASGETEIGKVAVAYAILNRKRSGRWGRKIADVVTSPWQFEPWMTRKSEIEGLSRTDPRYVKAAEIADAVLAGRIPDPTGGSTHFLNPVIVRERQGGSLPSWADSEGQPIGRHVFYCPECHGTKPTRAAVVESGEVKGGKATPAAADRVKAPRVSQTVVAEAPADVGAAKAAPAVLRPPDEKPEVSSKPKLATQRLQANLPWLNPSQAGQRRDFVPHTFW
jgi:cell wall hydrolase